MQRLDKIKEVKVAEQSIEVDPRSKTTADQAFNYIATGKPEMPVGGQKRMLPGKIVRGPTIRLEGRGSFDNFKFARGSARMGSHIG